MDIGPALPEEEPKPVLYIGQHDTQRTSPTSRYTLNHIQELGYDFVTTSITSSAFQTRVLKLVTDHFDALNQEPASSLAPLPQISPLTPEDTTPTPDDSNAPFVAVTSTWIDLGSLDPVIAHVSR